MKRGTVFSVGYKLSCKEKHVNSNLIVKNMRYLLTLCAGFIILWLISDVALAEDSAGWGAVAKQATTTIDKIGRLITAGSYLAGLGFSIGAIMQFKQHKDNPTQVTIGKPIALTFIAAALLFLPSILSATGYSLFKEGGKSAGPSGITYTK